MENVSILFEKYFRLINIRVVKSLYVPSILLAICVLLLFVFNSCISNLENEHEMVSSVSQYVSKIKNNPKMLRFMCLHKFNGSEESCSKFRYIVTEYCEKNKMIMGSAEESVVVPNRCSCFRINAMAWHDSSIFGLIERIYDYSPGYAMISNIHITRVSNITLKKPSIKLELTCDVYYSK